MDTGDYRDISTMAGWGPCVADMGASYGQFFCARLMNGDGPSAKCYGIRQRCGASHVRHQWRAQGPPRTPLPALPVPWRKVLLLGDGCGNRNSLTLGWVVSLGTIAEAASNGGHLLVSGGVLVGCNG